MDDSHPQHEHPTAALEPIDEPLLAELPTFELFFKTFGFKRIHGRVWGLLVLAGHPLSSREICDQLGISQGAASTTLNELAEWGAVTSAFDSARRCNLHAPVGNALSIVATIFRRREQVVFQQFRQTAQRSLDYVTKTHGERDPRVLTLRSILMTCDIADALMQLVFNAVQSAMADPESVLSKAITAAFKVGVGVPTRILFPRGWRGGRIELVDAGEDDAEEESRA
jgi:DNA-binding transcriptional regulator GbsR (MarR family)